MCYYLLESEMYPLFEVVVKISDFQIFTDSDRRKSEILYAINCDPITNFVLALKHTV